MHPLDLEVEPENIVCPPEGATMQCTASEGYHGKRSIFPYSVLSSEQCIATEEIIMAGKLSGDILASTSQGAVAFCSSFHLQDSCILSRHGGGGRHKKFKIVKDALPIESTREGSAETRLLACAGKPSQS